jgi:hypothetical protein
VYQVAPPCTCSAHETAAQQDFSDSLASLMRVQVIFTFRHSFSFLLTYGVKLDMTVIDAAPPYVLGS